MEETMPKVNVADKAEWHKTLNSWKRKYTAPIRRNIERHIEDGMERRYARKILTKLDLLEKTIDGQRYVQRARKAR